MNDNWLHSNNFSHAHMQYKLLQVQCTSCNLLKLLNVLTDKNNYLSLDSKSNCMNNLKIITLRKCTLEDDV